MGVKRHPEGLYGHPEEFQVASRAHLGESGESLGAPKMSPGSLQMPPAKAPKVVRMCPKRIAVGSQRSEPLRALVISIHTILEALSGTLLKLRVPRRGFCQCRETLHE